MTRSVSSRVRLAAGAAVVLMVAAGCSTKSSNQAAAASSAAKTPLSSVRIALVPGGAHPYFQPWIAAGAKAKADFGLGDVTFNETAEWDQAKQNAAINSLAAQGYNAMGIFGVSPTDINSTFVETMAQMGQINPNINIDIKTEDSEDLVEQAKKFAEEQSQRMRDSLNVMPGKFEEHVLRTRGDNVPLLATGEEDDEGVVLGTIYAVPKDEKVELEVLRYASTHEGALDVSRTSQHLGIPQDVVEQSMIHLVAQGKVKPAPTRSNE